MSARMARASAPSNLTNSISRHDPKWVRSSYSSSDMDSDGIDGECLGCRIDRDGSAKVDTKGFEEMSAIEEANMLLSADGDMQ